MAFTTQPYFLVSVMMLLLAALCSAKVPYISTRASYYHSPDGLGNPTGACGLGEYGKTINKAKVSAVSKLYKNGAGCGICYQVRCKNPKYCCAKGTKIVVTDYGEGDNTDFILSPKAYDELAVDKEAAKKLFANGVIEVEYHRIGCGFPNGDLFCKVDKKHSNPYYFAILLLYHGDKYYITEVKVEYIDEDGKKKYTPMRRAYGAVWDIANPPKKFDLIVFLSAKDDVQGVQLKSVIPYSEWNVGDAFDTAIDNLLS